MKKGIVVLLGVILVGILLVSWYINGMNRAVRLDERVNQGWSDIDSQLKRRNDLIPNLVNTVKGYAKHEKEVFTHVADARAALAGAKTINEKIDAAQKMDAALARLLMVVENYPALKADQTFLTLMDELSGTENRIAVARNRYNESVKLFNTYIREVFGSFFAKKRGLTEPRIYYKAEEKEKATPSVAF
jgi:LemA protein